MSDSGFTNFEFSKSNFLRHGHSADSGSGIQDTWNIIWNNIILSVSIFHKEFWREDNSSFANPTYADAEIVFYHLMLNKTVFISPSVWIFYSFNSWMQTFLHNSSGSNNSTLDIKYSKTSTSQLWLLWADYLQFHLLT